MDDSVLHARAKKIAKDKVGFQVHLLVYILVNLFLVGLWFWTSYMTGEYFPWFLFPLAGWGVGVAVHFFAVNRGDSYTLRLEEREYEKLKRKQGS